MIQILADFLPENCYEDIGNWFLNNRVHLKITSARQTKFGDFKAISNGRKLLITINNNINKYHFLVTILHEMAHAEVYMNCKNRKIKPHGNEWKCCFRNIAIPFLSNKSLPDNFKTNFIKYLLNPSASSVSNYEFFSVLRQFDKPTHKILVSDLSNGDEFIYKNNLIFKKIEKIRSRIKCVCLYNNKIYLFNPLVEVVKN